MSDLRAYLSDLGPALFRPSRPLSVVQEITALQHALGRAARYPVIHVPHPRLADGSVSELGVVTNLCASRELMARALGISDHRDAAPRLAMRAAAGIAPLDVARDDAPDQSGQRRG